MGKKTSKWTEKQRAKSKSQDAHGNKDTHTGKHIYSLN